MNTELTMLLSGRQLAHNKRMPQFSTHDPAGNRRIDALGNPRNGMRISDTRLRHLTLLLTQLKDNTQPYIYPAKYDAWDIQK